ncbi:MAG: hypothetical protein WAP74_03355 [Patescibacteria group bacterium]
MKVEVRPGLLTLHSTTADGKSDLWSFTHEAVKNKTRFTYQGCEPDDRCPDDGVEIMLCNQDRSLRVRGFKIDDAKRLEQVRPTLAHHNGARFGGIATQGEEVALTLFLAV